MTATSDVRVRRVYDPPDPADGHRVLVDRLWPRGLSKKAAALRPEDAEAQYGVGTFVWQILSAHGGGEKPAALSPWPAVTAHPDQAPPPAPAASPSPRARS